MKGLLHAHVGWLWINEGRAGARKYAPDLYEDKGMRRISHAFPRESSASQKTLVDLSSVSNRRWPKKWQTELIDQVMWCTKNTRTRPPQNRASSAAVSVPPMA